jgi:hypothetical protein
MKRRRRKTKVRRNRTRTSQSNKRKKKRGKRGRGRRMRRVKSMCDAEEWVEGIKFCFITVENGSKSNTMI